MKGDGLARQVHYCLLPVNVIESRQRIQKILDDGDKAIAPLIQRYMRPQIPDSDLSYKITDSEGRDVPIYSAGEPITRITPLPDHVRNAIDENDSAEFYRQFRPPPPMGPADDRD